MKKIISSIGQHPLIAERPHVKRFMKFGIVGVINTLLDYAIYSWLVVVVDVHYLLANVISFSIAVINSFLLNRTWTFRQQGTNWRREAVKYLTVYISGFAVGELLLYVFVGHLQVSELIGKAMVVAIVLFWNYFGIRFWAFKTPPEDMSG